ncbi:MAG: hypothetical protein HKM92_06955, partial [Arenibacter sp.]|nr:hypothetical protein [Arenibacter sp.]
MKMKGKNLKLTGLKVVLVVLALGVFSCKEAPKDKSDNKEVSEVAVKS